MQITLSTYQLQEWFTSAIKRVQKIRLPAKFRTQEAYQGSATVMVFVVLSSILAASFGPALPKPTYKLSDQAQNLLPAQSDTLAQELKLDSKERTYQFNQGYTGLSKPGDGQSRINATFPVDASSGIKVTDPVNSLDFTMKPKFLTGQGRQVGNRILYPLVDDEGYLVYSAQAAGVKEDILLNGSKHDDVKYDFNLNLPNGLESRLESDGSIGVYGSSLPINGNVSTGTSNDAALLNKVRQKATKDKLIFTIPAPVVSETNRTVSQVGVQYELHDNEMSVVVSNLHGAHYPLAIDPSVYVTTAQQFMRGNNESNIDFDTDNSLIKKGRLTGGRFDNWLNTTPLPTATWGQGTAVAGGYVYVVGGTTSSGLSSTVYWAQFNTTTYTIDAPNPGNGACSGWCNNSVYNLPVPTADLSLVAYNGYLYAFGGETSSGTTSAVYIAKLGANGEPSLWQPTPTDPMAYWYTAARLSTPRSFAGAAAYNNRMYLVGGRTSTGSTGVTTVEEADLRPDGRLGSWTTTGMQQLPLALHSFSMQIYNDRMYIIGGANGNVIQNTVRYIKLNNDGTMAGTWASTTQLTMPRDSQGGSFSTIWGGYIYIAGGCTELTGSAGYCTVNGQSNARDIEIASINADGTITPWTTITGLSWQRTGYGLVSWRNVVYGIGGCGNEDPTVGTCSGILTNTTYGTINSEGDVSQTDNSVASGTAPCTGANPYDCNIPPAGDSAGQGGNMAMGVVANDGFIYIVGGCTDVSQNWDCYTTTGRKGTPGGAMSGNVSYAAMAYDGSLVQPPNCVANGNTLYGSWCVDSTHRINGTTGLGAMGITAFNNYIYVMGGTDGNTWGSNAYTVPVNLDGSLATTWSSQSLNSLALGPARGFDYIFARANPTNNTYPGNIYVLGGCNGGGSTSNGLDCTTFYNTVYKCTIQTNGLITTNNGYDCTTTGQLQLDSEPGVSGTQGLGAMAGSVYANYVYLIGGQSPDETFRGEVMYAKIDNNLNIVSPTTGTATAADIWATSANQITPPRARGYSFGYNGYLYSLAGYSGSSSLKDVLYAKINVADGSIGTFAPSQVTVNPRWELRAFVSNGSVYAMGGCSSGAFSGTTGTTANPGCATMTNTIQVFRLYNNNSGTPATYTAYTGGQSPPSDSVGGSATVSNGYMYLTPGCTAAGAACTTVSSTIYYSAIAPDGTIGAWQASANGLPQGRAWGKLVASGGTLYYCGGQDAAGTAQSTVYYSTPSGVGAPAVWTQTTNGLPAAETEIGASVWNNRIYVTGGVNAGVYSSAVYFSPQLASGGNITSAWTSTTGFMIARSGEVTITYANNIYMLGGYNGSLYMSDVQFAQIASDGTVGAWSYTSSLTQRVYQGDGFAANGYMYVFAGRYTTTNCTNNTYVASISANTPISQGNKPTGVADWGETNVKFGAARYGVATAYNDGKAYVFGGACNGAYVASTDRGYVSTLQSQPMISKYSRLIDTDTDVFPTYWLMNGLDNFIGARWKLKYRSSTAANDAWGQETNYGTVTLGSVAPYIPLDGSGVNTNTSVGARYYYFNVAIDSSQAFGYPDDVTRGPTIDDITLFFTADPSKRLRHGATFTGGELQPLDTPPLP